MAEEVEMSQPLGYVDADYLKKVGEQLRPRKERSYVLMHVEAGQNVLDVGCGMGIDTIALAALVGEKGQVVGIDYDADMLAKADQSAQEAGVSAWVTHQKADVTQLPFEDNIFDSCRSERVFQHLPEPEKALDEMVRVTKPGGWIVVFDADWGALSINTPNNDLERRLMQFRVEHLHHNGYSGRKLVGMFKRRELADISFEGNNGLFDDLTTARFVASFDEFEQQAVAQGIITPDELARWQAGLKQFSASGDFFMTLTGMLVAGRKP
jgi:SAM-dependent methyltransferase